MFPLQDHFDVAHLLGHPAFDHLAEACSLYRCVHEHNLSDPSVHAWPECLEYGAKLTAIRRDELNACVQGVVLFQAMMEKVLYFVPTLPGGLTSTNEEKFSAAWKQLLDQISDGAYDNRESQNQSSYESAYCRHGIALTRHVLNDVRISDEYGPDKSAS